jgi:hypothetical protein
MSIYTPYTYLIGWTTHNKWYYGCQYCNSKSKGVAHQSNLWSTYFTSSKSVKEFRKIYGDPDIIKIRKTFNTKEECLLWEEKVIDKMGAVMSDKWLNKQNRGKDFSSQDGKNLSEKHKNSISNGLKNYSKTDSHKNNLSESLKGNIPWNKGLKTGPQSEEQKLKYKNRIPWNKGKKGLQVAWNKGVKKES